MQGIGIGCCSNDVVGQLELSPTMSNSSSSLSMELDESPESRIQRLISEHPVIIFTRSSCCMCHVMKKLLATIGVHPTVIELDDHEIAALPLPLPDTTTPAAFIGGTCIGGLESLVALHVSGHLIPKLVQVGALWGNLILVTSFSLCCLLGLFGVIRLAGLKSFNAVSVYPYTFRIVCEIPTKEARSYHKATKSMALALESQ